MKWVIGIRYWIHWVGVVALAWLACGPAYADCINIDDAIAAAPPVGAAQRAGESSKPPSGPATSPTEDGTGVSEGLLRVSREQLQMLRAVKTRLGATAISSPVVWICESDEINAGARASGPGIPRNGLIGISTGMMEMIGTDEQMVASLLAHEIAHIIEQHGARKADFARTAGRRAAETGANEEGLRPGAGPIVARQFFAAATAAYSRDIERRADEVGYQIYQSAGYDPRGAMRLFETVRSRAGAGKATYLDSHPGFDERIARLLVLSRDDVARAQSVANTQAIESRNNEYVVIVNDHMRHRRWRDLSALVSKWITELPESGLAWYYRGLLMEGSKKERSRAWEAFAKGVEFDPGRTEIWEALVEGLVSGGYRKEAAACIAHMSYIGHATQELRDQLFSGKLFVHGFSGTGPVNVWWARTEDGQRFISNDRPLFAVRGLKEQAIPPEWVPVN